MDIISPSVSPKIINNAATMATVAGATLTNGSGTATGSPITLLTAGPNTITITGAGSFTVVLPAGCSAIVTSGSGATVTDSPQTLVPGSNTVNVTGTGTIFVDLLVDNDLVSIPPSQVGYVKRLSINNQTAFTATLILKDVYTPDSSNSNPNPVQVVKSRYNISVPSGAFVDVDGHTISKHMGELRMSCDNNLVVPSYVLELE